MKKKKQKKTDAAGKYTLPAAGPGWEPSLPDPEQPPQVQRLPYRPDPARPPQVQLLQMQRSALPYVGRAGKNSGAANWVEKLDWKTPSGAPYTSAPEQGGPSNLVELIMAQRGGGGGGFSPGTGVGRAGIREPGARPPSVGLLESAGDFIGEKLYGLTEGAADVLDFLADPEKVNNFLYSDFIKDNTMAGLSGFNRSAAQTIDWLLPDVITLDPVQKLLDYYKELGGEQAARAAQTNRDLGMEQAGGLYQSAVQAAPNAVLAALSAGAGGTAQLGSASGSAVSAVVQQALESPAFWTSFLRTAGPSYEEAKAGGASEMEAALYALAGGLTSSGIEVGGGIEKMADKSGGFGMLQTMYEEGGEEAKQDILAKLLAKLLYDHGAEYFSASDEDAVFNPNRAFDAFSGGAALGGLFSAADLGLRDLSRAWSGAGESARPGADGLFTRDEVLKMDRAAVSENYDAIRRSMSLWDKDGRLPESMPERDVVDSQSPAGDNGGNASAELNAESARREEADRAENIIPNVGNASIDSRKLTDYALNPEHPVGGNKAKVFESALGYNKSNAEEFMQQIYEKLPGGRATLGKLDEFGQRYTVDISITGPNGNTVEVRTGWIIKKGFRHAGIDHNFCQIARRERK